MITSLDKVLRMDRQQNELALEDWLKLQPMEPNYESYGKPTKETLRLTRSNGRFSANMVFGSEHPFKYRNNQNNLQSSNQLELQGNSFAHMAATPPLLVLGLLGICVIFLVLVERKRNSRNGEDIAFKYSENSSGELSPRSIVIAESSSDLKFGSTKQSLTEYDQLNSSERKSSEKNLQMALKTMLASLSLKLHEKVSPEKGCDAMEKGAWD